ncbi:Ig-like domain-containing protein [Synechococcus sp. PCC 7336]|uniref:Ig-like domain-containing protein n=1 Tax=Synechococcus sp. PCC 7336 TaxID=195250 RepID=UPI00034A7A7C|nr:Ig-like domain-containing protein [Synechococcus sp. PCC 7336]
MPFSGSPLNAAPAPLASGLALDDELPSGSLLEQASLEGGLNLSRSRAGGTVGEGALVTESEPLTPLEEELFEPEVPGSVSRPRRYFPSSSGGGTGSSADQQRRLLEEAANSFDLLTGSETDSQLLGTSTDGELLVASSSLATLAEAAAAPVFAVVAEGRVTVNGSGDFDGNPLSLSDDARIYAGDGFDFQQTPILQVQLDGGGNPVVNAAGQLVLVENAVAVAADYSVATVLDNPYANLLPPAVVGPLTVSVPTFAALRANELAARLPAGATPIDFNPNQTPINTVAEFEANFPSGGTLENPTYVRVANGSLTIPDGVTIRNAVIVVESGAITFNGNHQSLDNVLLLSEQRAIDLGNAQLTDSSALAGSNVRMGSGARFSGQTLLANGNASSILNVNGATASTTAEDFLTVVAQGQLTFNGVTDTRAQLVAGGNVSFNSPAMLVGSVQAKGNITFNESITAIADSQIDTFAPVVTAGLANDTGAGSGDGVTNDPTISGQVTDDRAVAGLVARFANGVNPEFVDVLPNVQADGSFSFTTDQLASIYGGLLPDGSLTLQLMAQDSSGNVSEPLDLTFALDTAVPGVGTPQLLAGSDSGISGGDAITNADPLEFAVAAEVGSSIQLLVDGQPVAQEIATDVATVFAIAQLAEGDRAVTATATDLAGNASTSGSLTVAVDRQAPQVTVESIADGSEIAEGARLQGSVAETGSAIASLSYQFEGLATVEVPVNPDGGFDAAISLAGLVEGAQTLTLRASDLAGNATVATFVVTVVLVGDEDTTAPDLIAELAIDTGVSDSDSITAEVAIAGTVADDRELVALRAQIQTFQTFGEPIAGVDLIGEVQADGSFSLDRQLLEFVFGQPLETDVYFLELDAEDASGNIANFSLSFFLDLDSPDTQLALAPASDSGILGDRITGADMITLQGQTEVGAEVQLLETGARAIADSAGQFQFANLALALGNNDFTIQTVDRAGNVSLVIQSITRINEPVSITELSPANGDERVSLTREAIVRFSGPVDAASVNSDTFKVFALGEEVSGRIVVSSTGEFARFYPDQPWSESTQVRLQIDGDGIIGQNGVAIDADGDGVAGGQRTAEFSTLPLTRIPGTDVFGYVFDSSNPNADGSDRAVVGATIRVDAFPGLTAVTDENGFFLLEDVPAPELFVHIDGSTATSAPAGTTYATVGKSFQSLPGQATQLNRRGEVFDIFLPTLADGDIQALSATEETQVGFGDAGKSQLQRLFPEIDPAVWDLTQVLFLPGSAQDDFGNAATQATIIPVDPSRLPAPLPATLNPQLVISIQAGGATNFDVPAQVQFPNLEGLAPGEKSLIWSFDHDAGIWRVVGTGTVSDDGLMVVSDPGVGILAPGWHFVQVGTTAAGEECTSTQCVIIQGNRGDIVEIDLNLAIPPGGTAADWTIDPSFDQFPAVFSNALADRLDGSLAIDPTSGDIIGLNGQSFDNSGVFYFIPGAGIPSLDPANNFNVRTVGPDTYRTTFSAELTDPNGGISTPEGILEIQIEDGYSPFTISGLVGAGQANDNALDIYRVQHRLNYFDFPGYNQTEITVDGSSSGVFANEPFIQAIELFQAAIEPSGLGAPTDLLDIPGPSFPPSVVDGIVGQNTLDWLNAENAPFWLRIDDSLVGRTTQGQVPLEPIGDERFATSWTQQILNLAARERPDLTRTVGASNDPRQFQIGVTSLTEFPDVLPTEHGEHQAGHDIDFPIEDAINTIPVITAASPFTQAQVDQALAGLSTASNLADIQTALQAPVMLPSGMTIVLLPSVEQQNLILDIAAIAHVAGPSFDEVLIGSLASDYQRMRQVLTALGINQRNFSGHRDHIHISLTPPTLIPINTNAPIVNVALPLASSVLPEELPISTEVGFGSVDYLYYRFELSNGFELSGRSNTVGEFIEILPPDVDYILTAYHAAENRTGIYTGTANASGALTDLGLLVREEFGGVDTDADGIPDIGEFAIGTDSGNIDTDGDGISDAAELEQGLDPLDGVAYPTGLVARLPVLGDANAVIVEGETSGGQTAYVATDEGLAIVDVSPFVNPIMQGRLNLFRKRAVDVSVDPTLQIAVLATTDGLVLVDVSDPLLPSIRDTLSINATQVEVFDGIVYATAGQDLVSIDLNTGEELQRLRLPGFGTVTGLAREGTELYIHNSSQFSIVDISDENAPQVLGNIGGLNGLGIFAADGVAYLGGRGLRTIDVSDPTNPTEIADPTTPFISRNFALNGSGLALVASEALGFGIYDVSDPIVTDNFLFGFDTPGSVQDIAIASGVAFVADGAGDFQVYNYLPLDAGGQAPEITIEIDISQILEGETFPVSVSVSDDVQVRNVELLIDGEVVRNDVSFPFDLFGIAPRFDGTNDTFTVQVRVTDTGGNSALSELLVVQLVEDVTLPEIVNSDTPNGTAAQGSPRSIQIDFSEALDASTVNRNTFRLIDEAGNVVDPSDFQLRNGDRTVRITFTLLVSGNYQFVIDADAVTDRAGNPLGVSDRVETIQLAPDTVAPQIQSITPADGDIIGQTDTIQVVFSEAINPNSFALENFRLVNSTSIVLTPLNFESRDAFTILNITYEKLPFDSYQFTINASAVTDEVDLPLGDEDVVTAFLIDDVFDYGGFD